MNNFFAKANQSSGQEKRRAVFAGTWYEADPSKLRSQLERYIDSAEKRMEKQPSDPALQANQVIEGPVLAVVAPHAGYAFSGETAAFSYEAAAKSRKVKRVFLLGPSHYVGFAGVALPAEHTFATPLGDLAVDTEVIEHLKSYPGFTVMPEVHRKEHSLEMQLPFIRKAFGDVKIVPLLVGSMHDADDIQMTAQMLRRYLRHDDLVVVSSDFTHYGPRYQYVPFKNNIRENVKKLDAEAFKWLNAVDLEQFLAFRDRTQDTICGFYPCAILLALLPAHAHATLLNYRTSQDTAGEDESNSVSYLAVAFSSKDDPSGWTPEPEEALELTEKDKAALLEIARRSLQSFVRDHKQIGVDDVKELVTPVMKRKTGVFVTLYKMKKSVDHSAIPARADKDLRGCIGYIFPVKSLVQAVIDNAIGSASRDYRFEKVTANEMDDLLIDINVLTPPKRVDSYDKIRIGTDGVLMYKQGRQSVFLPSVATEFGWNLQETLSQLSVKAGLSADAWKQGAHFDTFQSISFEEHKSPR